MKRHHGSAASHEVRPSATIAMKLDPVTSAAWLYYHLDLNQADIAALLDVSRSSVANLLAKARELGIVRISVSADALRSVELASRLRERFGLADALVAASPTEADESVIARSLGMAAAVYLESAVEAGDVVATGWGRTLYEMARAMRQLPPNNVTIAQVLGGFSTSKAWNPSTVASLLAERLSAQLYNLYVPVYVASAGARSVLLADPAIQEAFEFARSARIAIVGIGKADPEATIVRAGFLSEFQMRSLVSSGAVGDVIGWFFDRDGRAVESTLGERIMAISIDALRGIPLVIGAGGGPSKVGAVLGALRGRLLDVLVTDATTAAAVLRLEELDHGTNLVAETESVGRIPSPSRPQERNAESESGA